MLWPATSGGLDHCELLWPATSGGLDHCEQVAGEGVDEVLPRGATSDAEDPDGDVHAVGATDEDGVPVDLWIAMYRSRAGVRDFAIALVPGRRAKTLSP